MIRMMIGSDGQRYEARWHIIDMFGALVFEGLGTGCHLGNLESFSVAGARGARL